jgi:hypothetical protein
MKPEHHDRLALDVSVSVIPRCCLTDDRPGGRKSALAQKVGGGKRVVRAENKRSGHRLAKLPRFQDCLTLEDGHISSCSPRSGGPC